MYNRDYTLKVFMCNCTPYMHTSFDSAAQPQYRAEQKRATKNKIVSKKKEIFMNKQNNN